MDQVSIGIAFLAGLLSFLSPCVLPLVPGYISFLSGISLEELRQGTDKKKVFKEAGLVSIFFVLGFSVTFICLGASASLIGKFLIAHIKLLIKIAGVLIFVLGLYLLGFIKIGWLNYERRLQIKSPSPGIWGAFLVGIAFGFGWTPCVGPILGSILALAATQETMIKGMLLLAVYSAGLGVPFIITGFAVGAFMNFFQRYKKFIRLGEIIAGVLLIGVGILMFFDNLSVLLKFVPDTFYNFTK